MLPLLLMLAEIAAPPPFAGSAEQKYDACVGLAKSAPDAAIAQAEAWRNGGGGILARMCLGLAYVAKERWAPAAAAFEQAARDAEIGRDGRAAELWVQAGNAALAGDEGIRAVSLLDRALALTVLTPQMRGEVHLDRARALVAMSNLPGARTDLDAALKLVPGDPLGWLLSATLARRMGDKPRATSDIAQAVKLAPDDASVAYEQGNVAMLNGAGEEAKAAWGRAAGLAPDAAAGKAAAMALKSGDAVKP